MSRFFTRVDIDTGKIYSSGIMDPEDAARMPVGPGQMMVQVAEHVELSIHKYVDLETHQLLDENRQPVNAEKVSSQVKVEEQKNPIKLLPSNDE